MRIYLTNCKHTPTHCTPLPPPAQNTCGIGGLFIFLGIMTASAADKYWQTMLSHGVCCAIGEGLLYIPIVMVPITWFSTRLPWANGVAVSGSAVGAVIWSVLFNRLLNTHGVSFGWSMRAIGFLQLASIALTYFLVHARIPRNLGYNHKSFPVYQALIGHPRFGVFAIAHIIAFMALYLPYFYITPFGVAIGASAQSAFYMATLLNGISFFGRALLGNASLYIGAWNTYLLALVSCGILVFSMSAIESSAGLWVWAAFYGFFSGGGIAGLVPCLVSLVPEPRMKNATLYMAIGSIFVAAGALIGEPIGGALVHHYGFDAMQYFAGTALLTAAVVYCVPRFMLSTKIIF